MYDYAIKILIYNLMDCKNDLKLDSEIDIKKRWHFCLGFCLMQNVGNNQDHLSGVSGEHFAQNTHKHD